MAPKLDSPLKAPKSVFKFSFPATPNILKPISVWIQENEKWRNLGIVAVVFTFVVGTAVIHSSFTGEDSFPSLGGVSTIIEVESNQTGLDELQQPVRLGTAAENFQHFTEEFPEGEKQPASPPQAPPVDSIKAPSPPSPPPAAPDLGGRKIPKGERKYARREALKKAQLLNERKTTEQLLKEFPLTDTGAGEGSAVNVSAMRFSQQCKAGSPLCMHPETIKPDFTNTYGGYLCLLVFTLAYSLVMFEHRLGAAFKKSTPMAVAAGVIWLVTALVYQQAGGDINVVAASARHNLLEFGEVFLFLLVAMTYINTLEHLQVFAVLRMWLLDRGFSLKGMFWITGALAFCLSPVADNLTTALLMGAVVIALGGDDDAYVNACCVNIVVASNAGGVFSPFGDVTTLMVWQKGKLQFADFVLLVLPGIVNWILPAVLIARSLQGGDPQRETHLSVRMHPGSYMVIGLFLGTILLASVFHQWAHLPPVLGMMTGLGLLKVYGYLFVTYGSMGEHSESSKPAEGGGGTLKKHHRHAMDIYKRMEHTEWDTLLFFYGVIMSVGGLGLLGYLDLIAAWAYGGIGPLGANVLVGLISALVDNIPVMFAVLSVEPEMADAQWLLVTLTAGVGGSMLSVGSAAGVGLMGSSKGVYNFNGHLQWSWAIGAGFVASIATHVLVNGM